MDHKEAAATKNVSREKDLEAPDDEVSSPPPPPPPVLTAGSPQFAARAPSEVTFGDTVSTPIVYTIDDLEGDNDDLKAEGAFIQAAEASSTASKNRVSSRSLFVSELSEAHSEDFEKSPTTPDRGMNEESGTNSNSLRTRWKKECGLRDLTGQLMTAHGTVEMDHKGLDGATQGTAADRMAETAALLFRSKGNLPEGVEIDSEGRPEAKIMGTLNPIGHGGNKPSLNARKKVAAARKGFKANRELFKDFLKPRKKFLAYYWWFRFKYLILPGTATAAILFYLCGNPPHGRLTKVDNEYVDKYGNVPETATVSWWFLFISVRQAITLASATMWELFLIDFLTIKSRIMSSMVGPYVSLWLAQSKGWPFRATAWGIINLIFLLGSGQFVNHWAYWQEWIDLFNGTNASGKVLVNENYRRLVLCSIVSGLATAAKRVVLSNVMGKRLVVNYGDQLEALMKDVLHVTKIATLSKRMTKGSIRIVSPMTNEKMASGMPMDVDSQDGASTEMNRAPGGSAIFGSFSLYQSSGNMELANLLGEWEEPETFDEQQKWDEVTIASLLYFRRALAFIDAEFPFSEAFGPAKTRQLCIESSQKVFDGLSLEGGEIPFNVFAPLVKDDDGNFDKRRIKEICKLLRPSAEGTLSRLEFVRSMDAVYKNLRTLIAAIESASQIENNYETVVNVVHYSALALAILSIVGVDAQSIIISFSAVFVGVGFIIGNACSKFLEGLLMIFVRRPFNVGDRIAIQDVTSASDPQGSPGWIVEKVDLYATTIRFAATREVATVTNGQLAASRIINLQRSKKAVVSINLKFGVDVENKKVEILRDKVQEFVRDRPREWVGMNAFRMVEIQADLGYVAYVIVLQHRDSWQNVGNILTSKAEVASFTLELSKQLEMDYTAPPLPVDLSLSTGGNEGSKEDTAAFEEAVKTWTESKKSK